MYSVKGYKSNLGNLFKKVEVIGSFSILNGRDSIFPLGTKYQFDDW